MVRYFRAEDIGKRVTTASGEEVGVVTRVFGSTAEVSPEPTLSAGLRERLGAGHERTLELEHGNVDAVTAEEVQLSVWI